MKCDCYNFDKPNEAFKSLKTNKCKNAESTILKTYMDCRNQILANNKLKNKEWQNKLIISNQENAIAPENIVDFIFTLLPENYDSDEYLFEKRFFIALELLLNIVNTNSEDQINKEVAQYIINLVLKADGFSWIYHKFQVLKNSISFVYYCNCREELENKKARVSNILSRHDTMPRIVRYACSDTIQINIEQVHNLAVVNVYHYLHSLPETMEVSSQILNYILYNNIKNEEIDGFLHITQKQVYYWSKKIATKDKATKTIIVDSTYGTNRLKFKLFAILGTIDGTGFPLSYFFLEPKCPYGKTQTIATWFKSLKENGIQNVETILTDKDREQITAANKIWPKTRIQLCYWHAHLLCPTIDPAWQLVNQNQKFTDLTNQEHLSNNNEKKVFCQKNFCESIIQMVTHQKHYPLLDVKEENAFSDLPENIRTLIKNLSNSSLQVNNQFHEQEYQVYEQESQVHEQESQAYEQDSQIYEQDSVIVNPNEYVMDIVDNNQNLILFQN
ncbi:10604_t:CDS:2 [Gigaspora margarita]|uniref:10604_t:CDS:1 n=1 Tax=Gigaspora margarita TaxID=4874 RepID=A0ABN7VXI4_GIGMA|nr:10604_t:CDS:2 [Gigaspora margarita]